MGDFDLNDFRQIESYMGQVSLSDYFCIYHLYVVFYSYEHLTVSFCFFLFLVLSTQSVSDIRDLRKQIADIAARRIGQECLIQ
jgi:hypothetical protein